MHLKDLPRRHPWVTLVILLSGFLVPLAARAEPPPDRLKSLTISVWLEYDRPAGLFIFRGDLPGETTLPARLVFRVPRRSGGPSSTAGIDAQGKYRYVRSTQREDGDSIVVEYETNWPRFQFEYYDDAVERQGQSRQLEFSYGAEYAIDDLVLEVKEPYGAAGFSLDPPADAQSQGTDGLTVHRRNVGPVAPGQTVRWLVSYDKDDARLSAEALGIPTPASSSYETGAGAPAPVRGNGDRVVFVLLAILGMVTLGGLGLSLRTSDGGHADAEADEIEKVEISLQKSAQRRRAKGAPEPPQVRPAKYCHQCGATLSRDDLFCRRCGTKRRGT